MKVIELENINDIENILIELNNLEYTAEWRITNKIYILAYLKNSDINKKLRISTAEQWLTSEGLAKIFKSEINNNYNTFRLDAEKNRNYNTTGVMTNGVVTTVDIYNNPINKIDINEIREIYKKVYKQK